MSESELKCVEVEPLLDAFHDGEIDEADKQSVERHLADCQPCQAKLAEIARLVSSLRNLPQLKLERDIADSIPALIESRKRSRDNVLRPAAWLSVGVAAAAAVFLFVFRLPAPQTTVADQGTDAASRGSRAGGGKHPQPPARAVAVNQARSTVNAGEPEAGHDEQLAARAGSAGREAGKTNGARLVASKTSTAAGAARSGAAIGGQGHGQTANPDYQVASAPASLGAGNDDLSRSGYLEVTALLDVGHSTITDEIGLSTDEDGLYAIKM